MALIRRELSTCCGIRDPGDLDQGVFKFRVSIKRLVCWQRPGRCCPDHSRYGLHQFLFRDLKNISKTREGCRACTKGNIDRRIGFIGVLNLGLSQC